jgi:predicted KAP-like P-loop ATPase
MSVTDPHHLSADRPLTNPRDDRLGYAPFAHHLAEALCRVPVSQGMVLALYGPWGSGKTTVLQFVLAYLDERSDGDTPIVLRFNPWWFSGTDDLTQRFFRQLRAVLEKSGLKRDDVVRRVAEFGDAISELPLPYANLAKSVAKVAKAFDKDIVELKETVGRELMGQDRRIIVLIDDMDRLTAEEIRQVFRLVKAVADFPNVLYLLAFDKDVVEGAIEAIQGGKGADYLEKIVQVPFELPPPDKTSLRKLLFEKLDAVIAGTPANLFDRVYWGNVYWDGIDHFIRTPRDVVRLTNTLSVTYPGVKGEVNVVDFIAIETLRVFFPVVYDAIRMNMSAFMGRPDRRGLTGLRPDELKAFHTKVLDQVAADYRAPVQDLVIRLFPRLEGVWGNVQYGGEWDATWRKDLRVCAESIFPTFFRLAVPEGNISSVELAKVLESASDSDALVTTLRNLSKQHGPDGTTRAAALLERLQDYTEKELNPEQAAAMVKALFTVGDELLLPEDEAKSLFSFGNDVRMHRVIWQLLDRLDESTRCAILRQAIAEGHAIATITREVSRFTPRQNKAAAPEASRTELISDPTSARELQLATVAKIRQVADDTHLLHSPKLALLLYAWKEWDGDKDVRAWVARVTATDSGCAEFLSGFVRQARSHGMSDRVARTHELLDPQELAPFVDPESLIERLPRMAEDPALTEEQRSAIVAFLRGYELRQKGRDPSWDTSEEE